jgi:hypothetical protein
MTSAEQINNLQHKILQTKQELAELTKLEQPIPELINTTNLLRTNEYLTKETAKKSQLLTLYEQYTNELENLVVSASVIKAKIKNLKSRSKLKKKARHQKKRTKKSRFKNKKGSKTKMKKRKRHR